MSLPIHTERLVLRRYTDADVSDIVALTSHESVLIATPEMDGSEASAAKYVETQNSYKPFQRGVCFDLAIENRGDGKVIGLLSLVHKEHRQGEIGFALSVDHRGSGYADEAARALIDYCFSTLGLHRVQANTTSDNPGAVKAVERLGMRPEGRLVEAELRRDAWVDVLIYGIVKSDWSA